VSRAGAIVSRDVVVCRHGDPLCRSAGIAVLPVVGRLAYRS